MHRGECNVSMNDERDHIIVPPTIHVDVLASSLYHHCKSQADLPCAGSNNKLNDEANNIVYNNDYCMSTDHHSTSMLCPS